MLQIDYQNLVVNFAAVRGIIILVFNALFVYLMIKKRISTLIALPVMGVGTALIASIGVLPLAGLFDMTSIDPKDAAKTLTHMGIFKGVIMEGSKMLASAIVAAVFGAAFTRLLTKLGVVETIMKKAAELAGDRPMVIAFVFFVAIAVVFSSIGGLGAVILVGSIALPIMLSVGLGEVLSGAIVLLGLSTGGLLNPANFATFASLLSPAMNNDYNAAYQSVAEMSIAIFAIAFVLSALYIVFSVRNVKVNKAWAKPLKAKSLGLHVLIAPIVPVVLVLVSTLFKQTIPAEVAILIGIIYLLLVAKADGKLNMVSSAFVEGTQDVAGAIVLLIGLGILIKGFQFFPVSIIITPAIKQVIGLLQNPFTYIIGFTVMTPLVLYRGPLNTFGIGGALPAIFAAAGFSPIAIIWVLRATGNMQGFGDPTNSQNIWVSNFVKVEPSEITKKIFWLGIAITFFVLLYAVFISGITLTV